MLEKRLCFGSVESDAVMLFVSQQGKHNIGISR